MQIARRKNQNEGSRRFSIRMHVIRTLSFSFQNLKNTGRTCSAPDERLKKFINSVVSYEQWDSQAMNSLHSFDKVILMKLLMSISILYFISESSPVKSLRH